MNLRMRYLTTLLLLSGMAMTAAPVAVAQQAPATPPPAATQQAPATPPAVAAQQTSAANPYQATVPVADTSAAGRGHAFAEALTQVLSRISGQTPAAAVLSQASTYVLQYQYQRAPAGSPQPFQLVVGFAPSAIKHLERTLGAPAPVTSIGPGGTAVATTPQAAGGDSEVWVSGIHSAVAFANALEAFRHAPGVNGVAVNQAQGDGMLLDVHTSEPLDRVLARLRSGGGFVTSSSAHAGAAASLRWQQ